MARMTWVAFATAMTIAASASGPRAAPGPAPAKALPADEPASPAIDPAKLAGSAVLRVTDARNRVASANNLKQIALAVHNYSSDKGGALPGDAIGKDGKQLLSWRVRLLPYVGEKALFEKFKLDEPWDSKHNLPLVEKMPKAFASPRVSVKRKGYTVYQVFSGPGALFNGGKTRYSIGNIPDGTSNTILAVEASNAVPWTKPADVAYDAGKPIPDFGKAYGGRPLVALADGSVRMLDLKKLSPATLKNAISPDDGNVLGKDWDD